MQTFDPLNLKHLSGEEKKLFFFFFFSKKQPDSRKHRLELIEKNKQFFGVGKPSKHDKFYLSPAPPV